MKAAQSTFVIVISILLIILSFVFRNSFMALSYSQFENVTFLATEMTIGGEPLTLLGAIASIPALYFLLKRIVGIKNLSQTFLFCVITLSSGVLFWCLRLIYIRAEINSYELGFGIGRSIAVHELKFQTYFWYGIVLGGIICFLLYLFVNKKYRLNSAELRKQNPDLLDQNDPA
jgi:hypothetical protein